MTICNMSIEAGARAGLIAPDETTFAYLEGRALAPEGRPVGGGPGRLEGPPHRRPAAFDRDVVDGCRPPGSPRSPGAPTRPVTGRRDGIPNPYEVPFATTAPPPAPSITWVSAGGTPIRRHRRRHRLHRLVHQRAHRGPASAAGVMDGQEGPPGVQALVVPGSAPGPAQAESEGLDVLFTAAGFDWRRSRVAPCAWP